MSYGPTATGLTGSDADSLDPHTNPNPNPNPNPNHVSRLEIDRTLMVAAKTIFNPEAHTVT